MIIMSPKTLSAKLLETLSENLKESDQIFTDVENLVNLANDVEGQADDLLEDFSEDLDKFILDEDLGEFTEKQTEFLVKWGERLEKLEEKAKELAQAVEKIADGGYYREPRPLELLDEIEREVLTN